MSILSGPGFKKSLVVRVINKDQRHNRSSVMGYKYQRGKSPSTSTQRCVSISLTMTKVRHFDNVKSGYHTLKEPRFGKKTWRLKRFNGDQRHRGR